MMEFTLTKICTLFLFYRLQHQIDINYVNLTILLSYVGIDKIR